MKQLKKKDVDFNNMPQNFMLDTNQDQIKNDDFVSLMTIHTIKVLEFDCIFVIGLNELYFPNI